mgnify:CR=1 FL=1
MNIDPHVIKDMQLQIDVLSRALLNISSELVMAGMAEHTPPHSGMIELGEWGIGLLTKGLGYKLEDIKDWDKEDV